MSISEFASRLMSYPNTPVEGADQYYPLNVPDIGTPLVGAGQVVPKLFSKLNIRNVEFKNRIFASPMCQYSSDDGHATDWHLVHLGGLASRGVGAIVVEATAVVPEGRISPQDSGIWADSHIEPLKRVVNFVHAQGSKIGIQLAHAGRKSSTRAPWVLHRARHGGDRSSIATPEEGGWPDAVPAPSAIKFTEGYPESKALTEDGIKDLIAAFKSAIERSEKAGFDFIEIHAAHGYLIHEFLSPLSNVRQDKYGGSLKNRLRFLLEITSVAREAWPTKPLFVRISATDWAEGPERDEQGNWKQWGIEQSTILVGELKKLGVDLIDVSSGGNWFEQKITLGPGYQVPFADAIKKSHPDIAVGAVGLITEGPQAESYLQEGKADVIFLGRALLKDPHWALNAAKALNVPIKAANQYERAGI